MKLTEYKIDDIKEHPKNYNKHPEDQLIELEKSLNDFEQYKNIVVWKGFCIAGNGLLMAAKRKGIKSIYAIDKSDLSEKKAMALLAADNATHSLAIPDIGELENLLKDIDFEVPGVTVDFLEGLNIDLDLGGEGEPEKEAPEEFPGYDEEIETEYCCPKCSYSWSGKPK